MPLHYLRNLDVFFPENSRAEISDKTQIVCFTRYYEKKTIQVCWKALNSSVEINSGHHATQFSPEACKF